MTEHLIERGHRNIVLVTPLVGPGYFAHFSIAEREKGYEQAMNAHGLAPRKIHESAAGSRQVVDELKAMLSADLGSDRVTGIVTYELGQAIQLRCQMHELGLRCPQDISIIAAEDLHHFRRTWPDISVISCNRYQMGAQAAHMMLAKIDHRSSPQPSQVFKGELIAGKTVAEPPLVSQRTGRRTAVEGARARGNASRKPNATG